MASESRGTATSHSGWDSGDGRVYNNNTCRVLDVVSPPIPKYYVYNFSFVNFSASATIDGIGLLMYVGGAAASPEIQEYNVSLCNTTTLRGTTRGPELHDTDVAGCTDCLLATEGGATDKWGLSQANINTYVRDNKATFGIAFWLENETVDEWYFDGAQITVYYTEPSTGYTSYVNEVPPANIFSVNEVLAANIAAVNEVPV